MDLSHTPSGLPKVNVLQNAWRKAMERVNASPRLYQWSRRSPLTRWVTRQRTQALFDVMAGFVHSQVLLACVRMDLFRQLQHAPASLAHLAERTGVNPAALQRLLLSAVALKLLEHRSHGRFGLGPLGVPLAMHPGIAAMVEHNDLLYGDMRDPLAFLQHAWQGGMADYWPYAHDEHAADTAQGEKFSDYSDLMAASQRFVGDEILATYPFAKHRCVLDVGAGKGRFACELARHAPQLEIQLFDLPPVLALAQAHIESQALSHRMRLHPGSFLHDDLPTGADLITLVRVAHDHPDDVVQALLNKIHQALPEGGMLMLAEPMAQAPSDSPNAATQTDAYFHFYLLAMGAGRLRTPEELMRLMVQAGFKKPRRLRNALPVHAQILCAQK